MCSLTEFWASPELEWGGLHPIMPRTALTTKKSHNDGLFSICRQQSRLMSYSLFQALLIFSLTTGTANECQLNQRTRATLTTPCWASLDRLPLSRMWLWLGHVVVTSANQGQETRLRKPDQMSYERLQFCGGEWRPLVTRLWNDTLGAEKYQEETLRVWTGEAEAQGTGEPQKDAHPWILKFDPRPVHVL